MLALLTPRFWIGLALVGLLTFTHALVYRSGRAAVRAQWNAEKVQQQQAAISENQTNAKETQRRLDQQQGNQNAQNAQLAAAKADAALNAASADGLRSQLAITTKRWRDALGNPAIVGDREAAADAIGVLADVLGRADRRAGILASYADAAHAAGLKCQRDYEALTP